MKPNLLENRGISLNLQHSVEKIGCVTGRQTKTPGSEEPGALGKMNSTHQAVFSNLWAILTRGGQEQ
jgi:hypothetical protein